MPVTLPVEIGERSAAILGETVNISAGGVLLATRSPLPANTGLRIRLNLPTGESILSAVAIVHRTPHGHFGLKFLDLANGARQELAAFITRILGYSRRGVRVPRRHHLSIRLLSDPGSTEQIAETLIVSLHGGLLISRAPFRTGDEIFVWRPDKKRGVTAKVVWRRPSGKHGMVELGFVFHDLVTFWDDDLENETEEWDA